jgi:hypothetical protein
VVGRPAYALLSATGLTGMIAARLPEFDFSPRITHDQADLLTQGHRLSYILPEGAGLWVFMVMHRHAFLLS